MIRLKKGLAGVGLHRSLHPLYEQHQATTHATFLDPAETGNIYSGMVMAKTGPDIVALCDGATQFPFGLSAMDRNLDMDDLDGMDIAPWAVYQSAGEGEFFVDAPSWDTTANLSVPSTGVPVKLWAGTSTKKGLLVATDPSGGSVPACAQLLEVVSATRLRIRLHAPTTP